jgi:hypothetical protein
MTSLLLLPLLAASNVPFVVLFGVFVLAFVTLSVIVLRWSFRRDRAGRAEWRQRQLRRQQPDQTDRDDGPPPPPRS